MWWALAGMAWTAVALWVGIGVGRTVRLREDRDDFESPAGARLSDMDVFESILDEPSPDHGMYRGDR
jgi:hypothetical protein